MSIADQTIVKVIKAGAPAVVKCRFCELQNGDQVFIDGRPVKITVTQMPSIGVMFVYTENREVSLDPKDLDYPPEDNPMSQDEAVRILNRIIDTVIEEEGMNPHRAAETLMDMGFEKKILTQYFGFSAEVMPD